MGTYRREADDIQADPEEPTPAKRWTSDRSYEIDKSNPASRRSVYLTLLALIMLAGLAGFTLGYLLDRLIF